MSDIESFPPLANSSAHTLILGSIPGVASLQAGQYYAHPRNQFWRILGEILAFDAAADYQVRVEALQAAGIAVWDVVRSCRRPGSLDASIDKPSIVANDFENFFRRHRAVRQVCFNGATAEQTYRRLVLPSLASLNLHYCRLPSTSPAHAGMSYQQKRELWQAQLLNPSI